MRLRQHARSLAPALLALALACGDSAPPQEIAGAPFGAGAVVGALSSDALREASGLVASARHPGHFWLHNDSGDSPRVIAVDSAGHVVATLNLTGARNRDWEDIARRGDTLFVADIGDNQAVHDVLHIYAIVEPAELKDATVPVMAHYRLRYPDGARDAETLLVDPLSGDWLIVTKREERVRIYRAAAPQQPDSLITLERVPGSLPFRLAVAGDVSEDGTEVLVKTYESIYYWKRDAEESLSATLLRVPVRLPYLPEPQGEAIGFALDGSAYFTTTERVADAAQPLFRYSRLIATP